MNPVIAIHQEEGIIGELEYRFQLIPSGKGSRRSMTINDASGGFTPPEAGRLKSAEKAST